MENTEFNSIKIGLASPKMIREWSHGEVTKPETINYRTQKPERDGLFCEHIFGPTKDWECLCGKYKRVRPADRNKPKICEKCGVEVTTKKVRRERMGHIELAAPVSHIWYFRAIPSKMGVLLDVTPKVLEKVLYFGNNYIVIDPGEGTGLAKYQVISGREKEILCERYEEGAFEVGVGAEAVKLLLECIGLDDEDCRLRRAYDAEMQPIVAKISDLRNKSWNRTLSDEEQAELDEYRAKEEELDEKIDALCQKGLNTLFQSLMSEMNRASGQKKVKIIKRLEIVKSFCSVDKKTGRIANRPEWMVLDVLPVIPPEIRPMVQLDGGRYASSDLNDLYRRVINRNGRLRRLMELSAPEIIIRNEKRMLQEAVDALIDNGRRGKPVTGPSNRPLKSLSEMLRGKQGRFRQNLLGKRVDYSGRSVIVVGPDLKIYQCGLPKEMALELFKPFVMKRLVETQKASNIKDAKKKVDKIDVCVWDALENVIKEHPVLLNRAPTLHRLSIQAFEPVLVEGRAIKLHPLVCTAFNADFDGDQMPVHVPLSAEAQAEARFLMLSANNLLKPMDGKAVTVPSQDMVLGSYYLTIDKAGEPGEGHCFRDANEAMMAYANGDLGLHAPIRVRVTKEVNGVVESRIISATLGRLIFNENIPQDLGYVDRTDPEKLLDLEIDMTCGKKQLGQIINRCIDRHGFSVAAEVLDHIKAMGYKYSTKASISISISDVTVPDDKYAIIKKAEQDVDTINRKHRHGQSTEEERYNAVIKIWEQATKDIVAALQDKFDRYNPIKMMSDSGARGNMTQMRQLAGMRGLMFATNGRTMEIPIKSNFREGLTILEYFVAARGARKSLSDTALKTADSGYLTRRLVDVSQDVIVRESDCGTRHGMIASDITDGKDVIEPLKDRIVGRFTIDPITDPETGEVIVEGDTMISEADAARIGKAGIKEVLIRSVLECKAKHGICTKCYGADLANDRLVNVGEAVGIIAAQSIGEPGTQLTMRTFHTGGVAGSNITQGLPRVEELFEARRPKKCAVISEIDGTVSFDTKSKMRTVVITNDETGDKKEYSVAYDTRVIVQAGDTVKKGKALTEGDMAPNDILHVSGLDAVYDYILREVQRVYRMQSIDVNDKHVEIIARQMTRKVRIVEPGSSDFLEGSNEEIGDVENVNTAIQARIDAGETDLSLVIAEPVLLGITKASIQTPSFLSAASFQETTKVLTEAAIKGKVDTLQGLKENVLIGKLIPAGTGMKRYRNIEVVKCDPIDEDDDEDESSAN